MSRPTHFGSDPRRAGLIQRYHTWPHLREQSVGEHSWQVCRIILAIWPEAPRPVLIHAMFHDVGELVAGDPPYPVKVQNPQFGVEHRKVEEECHLSMVLPWGLPPPAHPPEGEAMVVRLAHFIEMWEWGMDEVHMGNKFAHPVVSRCREAADQLITSEDHIDDAIRNRARSYIVRREQVHAADRPAD